MTNISNTLVKKSLNALLMPGTAFNAALHTSEKWLRGL
jgi:hypothetical protein